MGIPAILAPAFVQVALTFALLFWMGHVRFAALRRGEVRDREGALLGRPVWPARPTQAANAFRNQFELPVLFYALTALALLTRKADLLFVAMAWAFVLSRLVHAFVHVGSNELRLRFPAYLVGALVLLAMWAIFALRLLAAPA